MEMSRSPRASSGQSRALPGPAILGLLLALMLGLASTAAAATLPRLPRSDYAVRPACAAPTTGRASCLALGLEPKTASARARVHLLATRSSPRAGLAKASECAIDYPSTCLTPTDLGNAYFPGEQPEAPGGEPQTIAVVDAYNDPSAEADLNVYAAEFGLPQCTKANGCFKQVSETGSEASFNLPFPKTKAELEAFAKGTTHQREAAEEAEGWALEIATDIEVAHAICQNCHILLVEADSPEYTELETAENTAALHAGEISNSWGGPESGADDQAFNHPGIAITAAAGDDGYLNWDQYATRNEPGSPYFQGADYPASSPHVISTGGTHLTLDSEGAWQSESAWNSEGGGGSGCSESLPAPAWQSHVQNWPQVGCGQHRANADIAADADPASGVNVYDSIPYPYEEGGKKLSTVLHWVPIGGTSVASPIVASMVALAGGAHGVAYPAQTLYSHLDSPLLHDVTTGGNGQCNSEYFSCEGSISPLSPLDCGAGAWICNTTVDYDGPTGVGTPNGIGAFLPDETPSKSGEEGEPSGKPGEEQSESGSQGAGEAGAGGGSQGSGGGTPSSTGQTAGGTGGLPNSAGSSPVVAERSPTVAASRAMRLFALQLTAHARSALRRHGPMKLDQLAFSFGLSQATTVHATLAVRTGRKGHVHWQALRGSLIFAAIRGINRRRLHGLGRLTHGAYRLTLVAAAGSSRSLVVHVR
jgi:hypothetical protein